MTRELRYFRTLCGGTSRNNTHLPAGAGKAKYSIFLVVAQVASRDQLALRAHVHHLTEQGQIYRAHGQVPVVAVAVELGDLLPERPRVVRRGRRFRELADELGNAEGEVVLHRTQF